MTKQTKMYLGLGVLAVAAYYFWMKSSKDKANNSSIANTPPTKTNVSGPRMRVIKSTPALEKKFKEAQKKDPYSTYY